MKKPILIYAQGLGRGKNCLSFCQQGKKVLVEIWNKDQSLEAVMDGYELVEVASFFLERKK